MYIVLDSFCFMLEHKNALLTYDITIIRQVFIFFSYFTAGWVREVMYHPITSDCAYCYLWCRVCPSFSVREKDYQSWVLVKKDEVGCPGGEIVNAYCTCTAG